MENQYPKTYKLKNGQELTLRPLDVTRDEEALVAFFVGLPGSCTAFLRDDVRDPEVVRRFIRDHDVKRVWPIVALDDKGTIVGDATLHMTPHGWRRHVGEVRVVVAPAYHKQGLAKKLIHELVNQASVLELGRLEARILDNQEGARRAFEHLGFREEARLKDGAKDHDGQLHDICVLTNTVDDLWRKMEDMITDMEYRPDAY